jgi:hypothetical protein
MKNIWKKIKLFLNIKQRKEIDDGIKMFAKTEYKQDSEFAYNWMKENPNKVLCYWDAHK